MLIISLWYNITIVEVNLFGSVNEFRLYDFLGIPFFVDIVNKWKLLIQFVRRDYVFKRLFRFVFLCTITAIFTITYSLVVGNLSFIGMTIMYLYHFYIFAFLSVYVKLLFCGRRLWVVIYLFLLMSLLQNLTLLFQFAGILPHLIEYHYTEDMFTGMLGPNRIVPGMMCVMSMGLSLFLITYKNKKIPLPIKLSSLINLLMSLPNMVMIGSRTSVVFCILLVLIWIILYNQKYLIYVGFILIILFWGYSLFPSQVKERFSYEVLINRELVEEGMENSSTVSDFYQVVGNGRQQILVRTFNFLKNNPWIFICGKGFNNRIDNIRQIGAASPHDMYLNLIMEGGICALVLYLLWLFSYLKVFKVYTKYVSRQTVGVMVAFVIAMMASLIAGEHLYVYRSHYGILGAFLVIMTISQMVMDDTIFSKNQNEGE